MKFIFIALVLMSFAPQVHADGFTVRCKLETSRQGWAPDDNKFDLECDNMVRVGSARVPSNCYVPKRFTGASDKVGTIVTGPSEMPGGSVFYGFGDYGVDTSSDYSAELSAELLKSQSGRLFLLKNGKTTTTWNCQ